MDSISTPDASILVHVCVSLAAPVVVRSSDPISSTAVTAPSIVDFAPLVPDFVLPQASTSVSQIAPSSTHS